MSDTKFSSIFKLTVSFYLVLFLIILSFFCVLFYPYKPVVYYDVEMTQKTVIAGESLSYIVHFKKKTDRIGTMTRFLDCKNQSSIVLGPYGLADSKKTDTSKPVRVEIPIGTKSDICKVRWIVEFNYFGIRNVWERYETPEFEVKESLIRRDNIDLIKEVKKNTEIINLLKKRQDERIEREKAQGIIK